jgi:DNA-nicking Smr family endonuclease
MAIKQLTVEVTRFERVGEVVNLEWSVGERTYTRTVTAAKIDKPEKLAQWLVAQPVEPAEESYLIGRYVISLDDAGKVSVARDNQVQAVLDKAEERQAQIESDLKLLPDATTNQVKQIIGRMLHAESMLLSVLVRIVRLLKRLAE